MRSRLHTPAAIEGFYAGVFFLFISSDNMCDCVYRCKRNVIFERGDLVEAFCPCWFVVLPFNFFMLTFLSLGLPSETAPSLII